MDIRWAAHNHLFFPFAWRLTVVRCERDEGEFPEAYSYFQFLQAFNRCHEALLVKLQPTPISSRTKYESMPSKNLGDW